MSMPVRTHSRDNTYAQNGPILVELFTSAGCPSCPRADAHLRALVGRGDVIALACHVSYFGQYEHTQAFCDQRQKTYLRHFGVGQTFTPMMVVDGQSYVTGVKREALAEALDQAAADRGRKKIKLVQTGADLSINLPQMALKRAAEIWLIEYAPNAHNAVTRMSKIMGSWDGAPMRMAYPASPHAAYALIAQNRSEGIIAAGKSTLN